MTTLRDAIDRYELHRVDGHESYSRWVIVRTDSVTPRMFGDVSRVEDYQLCNVLPREHGMVFMFQRVAKPLRKEAER